MLAKLKSEYLRLREVGFWGYINERAVKTNVLGLLIALFIGFCLGACAL